MTQRRQSTSRKSSARSSRGTIERLRRQLQRERQQRREAAHEAKEALERQTATAEILKVISSSPAATQPVFEAIVESAARLFAPWNAVLVMREGDVLQRKARAGPARSMDRAALASIWPLPFDPERSLAARCIVERRIIEIPDTEAPGLPPIAKPLAKAAGYRSITNVPLLRGGEGIGLIALSHPEPGFKLTEKQLALVRTFADQAVIAIQNARLLNETKDALEQQTATSEVLKVISRSPGDVGPVFKAILETALRLCQAHYGAVLTFDGEAFNATAYNAGRMESALTAPIKPGTETPLRRVALELRTVHTADLLNDARFSVPELYRQEGMRAALAVPLLKDGKLVGALAFHRLEVRPFTDKQIALIETFADQAVIAIENVRLFNETKEALEQQTATSEILGVISSSPTDLAPVFTAILKSALDLCEAHFGHLNLFDGENHKTVAHRGATPEYANYLSERRPYKPGRSLTRMAAERRPVQVPDLRQAPGYLEGKEQTVKLVELDGARTSLYVPLLKDDKTVGAIIIYRREVRPFTEKQVALVSLFANQAVIAIENARLFNETKESLEQQTATAEILKVISSSPTDVQPVFEAIVQSAARLFNPWNTSIIMREGDLLHRKAFAGPQAALADREQLARIYPRPFDPMRSLAARSILEGRVMEVLDTEAPGVPESVKAVAQASGFRSVTAVPLMREGEGIGVIGLNRPEVGFKLTEKQLALVRTFADQAVIAIENVRLFNETKEALERQIATADILKVLSSSPTDVQPVFDAIVQSAARLFGRNAALRLVEGGELRRRAHSWVGGFHGAEVLPIDRDTLVGRVVLDGKAMQVVDTTAPDAPPYAQANWARLDYRANAAAPLLRDGAVIGLIAVSARKPEALSDKQMALLATFADQAVIAIENARLFNETKEALEQQTATAEILKVISSSTTDTQPVFEAIVQSAARLFAPCLIAVVMREGDVLVRKARAGPQLPQADQSAAASMNTLPLDPERSVAARSIIERRIIEVPDTEAEGLPTLVRSLARAVGYRAITVVPLIKEGEGIGVIGLSRPEPGFKLTEKQLALMRTFADQAVIAIENVRLFKELQQRTEALIKLVSQLTALGKVGQAITSTLDLETVLKTIVAHAVQLTGLDAGAVYEYDEQCETFHLRAAENLGEEIIEVLRTRPIRKGDGVVGATAVTREPMQIQDTQDESYQSNLRELVIRTGRRALLAVPLMRDEHIIGALTVQRNAPGPFAPEIVELLKTFATQSAMAIQNARLFREIAEKGKQLEVASRHKSDFLASMSHELRTPLNAILGFNEMVIDEIYGPVPEDMKSPLENIQSSGKHLLRLINNVLDLAKIEAGRMELALSDYSVQDTVSSVHSTLRALAAEKGLEFIAEVSPDIPPAYGDAGRLAQCVMNLAGNALKFTRQGSVAIAAEQRDGLLRFSVADTGIGIPPEKIGTLFTEFKQTDATIASEYGGTGLGLSITKKFIEMHGGRIWVESEQGKGSKFLFEIPLRVGR